MKKENIVNYYNIHMNTSGVFRVDIWWDERM
jgi:hypothetical protein